MSGPATTHDAYYETDKKLSPETFAKTLDIITRHELPVTVWNPMGFNTLAYCAFLPLASTPGVHELERILCISEEHLPNERGKLTSYRFSTTDPDAQALWKLANRPRNRELLTFYGLDAIKERSHYTY